MCDVHKEGTMECSEEPILNCVAYQKRGKRREVHRNTLLLL